MPSWHQPAAVLVLLVLLAAAAPVTTAHFDPGDDDPVEWWITTNDIRPVGMDTDTFETIFSPEGRRTYYWLTLTIVAPPHEIAPTKRDFVFYIDLSAFTENNMLAPGAKHIRTPWRDWPLDQDAYGKGDVELTEPHTWNDAADSQGPPAKGEGRWRDPDSWGKPGETVHLTGIGQPFDHEECWPLGAIKIKGEIHQTSPWSEGALKALASTPTPGGVAALAVKQVVKWTAPLVTSSDHGSGDVTVTPTMEGSQHTLQMRNDGKGWDLDLTAFLKDIEPGEEDACAGPSEDHGSVLIPDTTEYALGDPIGPSQAALLFAQLETALAPSAMMLPHERDAAGATHAALAALVAHARLLDGAGADAVASYERGAELMREDPRAAVTAFAQAARLGGNGAPVPGFGGPYALTPSVAVGANALFLATGAPPTTRAGVSVEEIARGVQIVHVSTAGLEPGEHELLEGAAPILLFEPAPPTLALSHAEAWALRTHERIPYGQSVPGALQRIVGESTEVEALLTDGSRVRMGLDTSGGALRGLTHVTTLGVGGRVWQPIAGEAFPWPDAAPSGQPDVRLRTSERIVEAGFASSDPIQFIRRALATNDIEVETEGGLQGAVAGIAEYASRVATRFEPRPFSLPGATPTNGLIGAVPYVAARNPLGHVVARVDPPTWPAATPGAIHPSVPAYPTAREAVDLAMQTRGHIQLVADPNVQHTFPWWTTPSMQELITTPPPRTQWKMSYNAGVMSWGGAGGSALVASATAGGAWGMIG